MKIVSRQTLQNLIRHQLLEHYTKKISLLTENAIPDKEILIKSINEILPDDSGKIFLSDYTGKPKGSYLSDSTATASQLGYARTGLVLNCLYELLSDDSIQKKLEDARIVIDPKIKSFFSDKILKFFTSIRKDADNKLIISAEDFNKKIINLKKEIENQINSLPDFLKFLLKDPSVILEQLTDDKVFNAWNLAWFNSDKSVALITNPGLEGNLSYENNVKPDIVAPLTTSLDKLIPMFTSTVTPTAPAETPEEKVKREAEEKAKADEKNKKKTERTNKINSLKSKIDSQHNISNRSVLTQHDIDKIKNKNLDSTDKDIKNLRYNSEALVTELFVYYILLNTNDRVEGKKISGIGKIKSIITAIDSNSESSRNIAYNQGMIDHTLSVEKLGFNIYDDLFNLFGNAGKSGKRKEEIIGDYKKLIEYKTKVVTSINKKITDKSNDPGDILINNVARFLNEITDEQFKNIRDAINNSTNFKRSFDYSEVNNFCAVRVHKSSRLVDLVSEELFKIITDVLNKIDTKKDEINKAKEDLTKTQKEEEDENKREKEEEEKKKVVKATETSKENSTQKSDAAASETNQLESPNPETITDDNWRRIIEAIKRLKDKPKENRNADDIQTIKQLINACRGRGISDDDIKKALSELEQIEKEQGENVDGEEEQDTNMSAENELENIFRVPQLNGGYGQLAQILTSSVLLKNYKSGNFKRGKYDKADSYGYIFMDDGTMDKAANLYNAAIKTLSRKISLSPAVEKKIEAELKDYKKIGSYLNEYFNKKMLLANEYLLIDGSVILYLALRVLENLGLEGEQFQQLHQDIVVNKDPVVIPHNIKITNLDDAIAKKVDLNKRISIDQMFQNRKAKNASTSKNEKAQTQANTPQEKPTPIEDEDVLATKSLKRVKALITQLGGKMFKQDIEDDDLITRAANGKYSKGQLGREIVQIANTVYQRANDFDFNEFEKKQLKLGLQNYFEQKLSNYNGTDDLIQTINQKINQL